MCMSISIALGEYFASKYVEKSPFTYQESNCKKTLLGGKYTERGCVELHVHDYRKSHLLQNKREAVPLIAHRDKGDVRRGTNLSYWNYPALLIFYRVISRSGLSVSVTMVIMTTALFEPVQTFTE